MHNNEKVFEEFVLALLPVLTSYVNESLAGKTGVVHQESPEKIAAALKLEHFIRNGGLTAEIAKDWTKRYLDYSQHMHHPRYIGHQVSSHHLASGIADFIQGVINNPMAIYEMGPGAAVIEKTIIHWMLEKVGWRHNELTSYDDHISSGGGVLTHGGSLANLTAMLAARAKASPDSWEQGNASDMVVIGSEVSHYSIARAVSIMGLGKQSLIKVPTDDREVLKADQLPKIYTQCVNEGKKVMAVISNACATSTGLYDPLEEIGIFCKENNLWYHIDGAHGAAALLHPSSQHYMKGVQYADSIIWDTHKMLRTTALCAAVLFKRKEDLENTFRQKGSYIFHEKEKIGFDLMPYTVECTKAAIGTKLFWVLAAEGEKGLGQYVANQYQLTHQIYTIISEQDDFECPFKPEANILCFRYTAGPSSNEFQLSLRNRLILNQQFYITSAEVNGVRYLRLTVINAATSVETISELLNEIRRIALKSE